MKELLRAVAALLLAGWVVGGAFPLLQGGEISLDEIMQGKWCLAFVVAPKCTACDAVIGWLEGWNAQQTQSEIQAALVVPWETPELRETLKGVTFPVIIDSQFVLAAWFRIKVAPTVVLFAEGAFSEKLVWPFSQDELASKLKEFEEFVIPRPQDLIGAPSPELVGVSLEGDELRFKDLPKPVLLFFFSTTCPACKASLEFMDDFTEFLPVALVVLSKGHELSEDDREVFSELEEKYGEKIQIIVLGEREKETVDRYRIRWTPTFFLVDGNGVLRAVWEGPSGTMIQEIEEILGE